MSEFRGKLILQNRKVLNGVVGDGHNWAGNGLAVVVHAFNRKVVVARTLTGYGRSGTYSDSARARHACIEQ